jgi:hypothetical protein
MADPLPPQPAPAASPSLWDLLPKPSPHDIMGAIPGAQSVADAAHWVRGLLPTTFWDQQAEVSRKQKEDVTRFEAERDARFAALAQKIPTPIRRGVDAAKAYAASLFEPTADAQALGGVLKDRVASQFPKTGDPRADAISAPWRVGGNEAVDQLVAGSSGGGALLNADIPGGPELAALPIFPGGRRPALNAASRRAVEDARQYLQNEALKGPIPQSELRQVLATQPFFAHKITKGLPVEEPLGAMSRILTPRPGGGFDFSPGASARSHGMADIGAALPFQANWGSATDPALLPAFNNDKQAAELFGRFFAAASPRTSVSKNALENLNVWRDFLRTPGRPFTDERLRALGLGNVRAKTDNIIRAILGDAPSGEKVDLFTDFMAGRTALPVPDVHGLYGIGSQHGSIDSVIPELRQLVEQYEGIPARRGGLTKKDYVRRLIDAYGRDLQAWGPGQGMGPLFGTKWEGVRGQKGLPFQGGMIDIYGKYGLDQPGAMFNDRLLSDAIKNW